MSTEIVHRFLEIPDAPAVPGLRFRHFAGDQDYAGILRVNNASKIADDMGHDLHTLETITYVYSHTPNHLPEKDMLIAEVAGAMVGFNRVFWDTELGGTRVYAHVGFVVPEWRGKGIGRALLRAAERRAREIEAERADEGGETHLATFTYGSMKGLANLLDGEGYKPVRYSFYMETPDLDNIPEASMPDGLEIRPAKPEHYRAVWEANTEAFRDHWGAGEAGSEGFDTWINHPFQQPDLWVVAWDGDKVAGSILNYINHDYNERTGRKLGYTESISVRRPWRRRGLARAMLARSMKLHKSVGMEQTGLGVDTENPSGALELYKSMGYRVVGGETHYRKIM